MNTNQTIPLIVDLAGLVNIFGDALYKDFGSIVRELVQNAHDTIIESCAYASSPHEAVRAHSIKVILDVHDRRLIVADDGKGMTRDEIAEKLNNFARSKKHDLERYLAGRVTDEGARQLMHIVGELEF